MLKRILNSHAYFLVALVILACFIVAGCGSKEEDTASAPAGGMTPGAGAPGMAPGAPGMGGGPGMGGAPGMTPGASGAMGTSAPTASTGSAQPTAEQVLFSKVSLQSPVKAVTNPLKQVFLSFKYADVNGIVYEAYMPKVMSEGNYSKNEWILTFNAYRKSAPIKKIKMASAKSWQSVEDYPFISPRPIRTSSVNPPSGGSGLGPGMGPGGMPGLPPLPGMGAPGMPPAPR